MKNKFKINIFLIAMVLMIAIMLPVFLVNRNSLTTFADDEAPNTTDKLKSEASQIVNMCLITQTGVVIKADDFRQVEVPFTVTNASTSTPSTPSGDETSSETEPSAPQTTVQKKLVNVLYLVGSVTINPIVKTDGSYEPTKITKTPFSIKDASDNKFVPTGKNIEKGIFCRETDDIPVSSDIAKIDNMIFGATPGADVFTKVTVEKTNTDISVQNDSYDFYIYQVNNLHYDNSGLNWQSLKSDSIPDNYIAYDIIKPGENQVYSDWVELQIDTTSFNINKDINEFFIDFWHNGKAYSLKLVKDDTNKVHGFQISNNYFSQISEVLQKINKNISQEELKKYQDLTGQFSTKTVNGKTVLYFTFAESGEYKVRVYDKTYNGASPSKYNDDIHADNIYKHANIEEYNFVIENTTKFNGFYYTATSTENGTNDIVHIVSEYEYSNLNSSSTVQTPTIEMQRVNRDVKIVLKNLSNVSKITKTSYHIESYGDVLAQDEITSFEGDELTLILSDEATYNIVIEFNDTKKTVKQLMFQILKSVRSSYDFEGHHYPEETDNIQINIVKHYEFPQQYSKSTTNAPEHDPLVYSSMGGNNLVGFVETKFNLYIAKSVPSISGVANRANTHEAVALTLTGVATDEIGMKIRVVRDGQVLLNTTLYNQNIEQPLSYSLNYGDLGHYTIQLTDAMNNSTTLQFTISTQQNAAGIILIVLGCALALAVVILIIRARSKVAVR